MVEAKKQKSILSRLRFWSKADQASTSQDDNQQKRSLSSFIDWDLIPSLFGFGSSKGGPIVNKKSAQGIPALFRAWSLIAEQIASLPFSVYRREGDKVVEAKEHPLYKLLKFRPHPLYSTVDFREAILRKLLSTGTCCIRVFRNVEGQVSRLEILEYTPDIFELPNKPGVYFYKFSGIDKPLRNDEVIHLKGWTMNGIEGQNPMQIFKSVLSRALSEIEFGAKYFANGAHLSGLLIPESNMRPEQQKQLLDSFRRDSVGIDNMGQVGALPFAVKYQELGKTPKDSQYVEGRALTNQDISNMTGVISMLLGETQSTFANAEQQMIVFVKFVLRYWCRKLEAELNTKLFPQEEWGEVFVEHNINGLLQGDSEAQAKFLQALFNIRSISPNEIRKMLNLNPYEGGDEYGMPFASNTKENKDEAKQAE